MLSFFTPDFLPAAKTILLYQLPSFFSTTVVAMLLALYSSSTKLSDFFNSSNASTLSSFAFNFITSSFSFSFSFSNFLALSAFALNLKIPPRLFDINENPLFTPFPTLVTESLTGLVDIGFVPENLKTDIPTIPIKVIATTPVAITLTLIFFLPFLGF